MYKGPLRRFIINKSLLYYLLLLSNSIRISLELLGFLNILLGKYNFSLYLPNLPLILATSIL